MTRPNGRSGEHPLRQPPKELARDIGPGGRSSEHALRQALKELAR